jgi:hypothetical protein
MEGLDRLVSESLARHGFDRPLDYRRLRWSRWFRCESVHSLLFVPSQPGVFALAEEMMDLGTGNVHVGADAPVLPAERGTSAVEERPFSAASAGPTTGGLAPDAPLGGAALQGCDSLPATQAALAAEVAQRRMLAVTQFFEADDMAFVLDRMLSTRNPMRARLLSGNYFVRFVAIEDPLQRRSICGALNQWISNSTNSSEKASGIGAHFATSLEINETNAGTAALGRPAERSSAALTKTVSKHTAPFPSGF